MLTDYRNEKLDSINSMLSKISARIVSYPLELKLIQSSDVIMTVSNTIAQELKEEYHVNSDKISVVGNGIDEKLFCPGQQKSENNNKYILFTGRIVREKGIFDLLECAKYIYKKRSDISIILAGQGRDFYLLKRKISNVKLQDKLILLKQVDKERLVKLYQNASLFVLPSYHEGLPTALLEAMSCGLPVIVTDVRGNRDVISSGNNGIIVPPRAPKKLAEALLTTLEDETLMKTLGKNARKTVEDKYTWDIVYHKILRHYELLV